MSYCLLYYKFCSLNKTLFFIIIFTFSIFGCNKFEEGVNFSLRSKTKRLTNTWKYISVYDFETGKLQTTGFEGWTETIKNDGSYEKTIVYFDKESVYNGNWIYDGKRTLQFTYTMHYVEIMEVYIIKRLSNNELYLENSEKEIHFQKK